MKILRQIFILIVISLFCMSFLVHCFFALMLAEIADNIRVEEQLRHSWILESPTDRISNQELNAALKQISYDIVTALGNKGYIDVSVSHEIIHEKDLNLFFGVSGVNFYVRYDVRLGERMLSGVSRHDKDCIETIIEDNMNKIILKE